MYFRLVKQRNAISMGFAKQKFSIQTRRHVRFLACNGCSVWRVLGAAKTVIRVP